MSSQPPSTASTAPPTFQENGEPAQFLDWVQSQMSELLEDPQLMLKDRRLEWVKTVSSLLAILALPRPEELPWHTMHEQIKLAEVCLQLIFHAAHRVPSLLAGEGVLAQALFTSITILCITLDLWIDVDPPPQVGYLSPAELYDRACTTSAAILQALGDEVLPEVGPKSRQLMQDLIVHCSGLVNNLLSISETTVFPFSLQVYTSPEVVDYLAKMGQTAVLKVADATQVPPVLTTLLEICLVTLTPNATNHWFLAELTREMTQLAQRAYDHFFFCLTPGPTRMRAVAKICVAASNFSTSCGCSEVAESYWARLLLYRLDDGPDPAWEKVECSLTAILQSMKMTLRSHDNFHSVLKTLQSEEWGEDGNSLRELSEAYLVLSVESLDEETLRSVNGILNSEGKAPLYPTLLGVLNDRLRTFAAANNSSQPLRTSWQVLVHDAVQAIIEPHVLDWMDDDESLTDIKLVQRALDEINSRFEGHPVWNTAATALEALAKKLSILPCLLYHAKEKCTPAVNQDKRGVCFITVYMKVAFRILECDDSRKVHPRVSAAVYEALARSLRHQTAPLDERMFEDLMGFLSRGMKDKERTVRLAAGRAVLELVRLAQRLNDRTTEFVVAIFQRINPLIRHPDNRVKETTIVTVGLIGRSSLGIVLRESVCTLAFQIGQPNPILRGTIWMQLHAIARDQKKSPYNLTAPFFDRIAPYMVRRLQSEPGTIAEFCNFISMSLSQFVEVTQNFSLPHLFTDGDLKLLDVVAKMAQKELPNMILGKAESVLTHIFMLQGIGQTNKSLQLVLNVYRSNSLNPESITLQHIIRSHLIELVTGLVGHLGDEDPDVVDAAHQGLRKVVRALATQQSDASGNPKEELAAFLHEHMLGVISILNDMLQGSRGKRSVEASQRMLRSVGEFGTLVGPPIVNIAPQVMATLQTMVVVPDFSDAALYSWHLFIIALDPIDVGPYVGSTSASFLAYWSSFSDHGRELAKRCLHILIVERGPQLGLHLAEVADLGSIPELHEIDKQLTALRAEWSSDQRLHSLLDRLDSDSVVVAVRSATELKAFLLRGGEEYVRSLTSGDVFDPIVGHIISVLYRAACKDGEEHDIDTLRTLAYDCIGIVGAIDPDRFELRPRDHKVIMTSNFADEAEATTFALHLIQNVLSNAYRSTTDTKHQSYLAYAIQQLLVFCKFTPALVNAAGPGSGSVPIRVRHRWNSLPKFVLETITPLLEARFQRITTRTMRHASPIYPNHSTYRQWVQAWTTELIHRVTGKVAKEIFEVFLLVVGNKDVGVALHLLPHLVLYVLASENEDSSQMIRNEIILVLEDQVNPNSPSSPDKKQLSAQLIFMLLDHLNKWIRVTRQDIARQRAAARRSSRTSSASSTLTNPEAEEQLLRIDSILSSVDHNLMAKAALQCKAYARSLMTLEQQVVTLRERNVPGTELQDHYERLHEMYAHLDEPDGMEGLSTMILSPSLEHQIRQHESTGRWTSAQSCWEVRLQHEPDNLEYHLGLLRCLRNLGHYDSLRTHVKGVLTRNPDWGAHLVGYQVESEWMVGHWSEVQNLVSQSEARPPLLLMAQVLLAMRSGDDAAIASSLTATRKALGASITASGETGYRRSYDAVLDLHLVHELEIINSVVKDHSGEPIMGTQVSNQAFNRLLQRLAARFDCTLPSFRIREPILNMRRTAFNLSVSHADEAKETTGKLWLNSAKIARKAGHSQTAYSATLQAQRCNAPFAFIESVKLVRARGEPLRALQELENSMRLSGFFASQQPEAVIDLTVSQDDTRMKAKAHVLHARWMADSERFEDTKVHREFQTAAEMLPRWESGQFHLGQFQDECFKLLSPADKKSRGMRMNLQTVRCFTRAIKYGSKYIYQTLPRVLTIWLDMAEDDERAKQDIFTKINTEVARAIKGAPVYKWYTAFPQIVSRIGLQNQTAYEVLSGLITTVIQEYPRQALWLFTAVAKSITRQRAQRSKAILHRLRSSSKNNVAHMISTMAKMAEELLKFCHRNPGETKLLHMSREFQDLKKILDSVPAAREILIPLQECLTANLPPSSASESNHQPFPVDAPSFTSFFEEVEVMSSLAKPKKLSIMGSNGQVFTFLGKKEDLRKDGRLMDFDAILNKLLRKDSDSRRRQLNIRTYGVVSLNEECGLIQWVPNTIPVRPILQTLYTRRGRQLWGPELRVAFDKIKATRISREAAVIFTDDVLPFFPPVLHEWFVETFSEPTLWLASRTAYSRTAAVMSMVGYILGLGDRHCENILLDTNCGDVIHVDFDCLFEKGQALETPEIVPFRLTHNIVDGFGVTGVEGVFRIACEVTLRLLRENKDCLMNVLDAFVHDPLVEWEEKRRRLERNSNVVADMRVVSQDALGPIEEKLQGVFRPLKSSPGKQLSVTNHVQALIHQATDPANLARMYVGWAPFQ